MSVNEKMTAIADAIRDKTGSTEPLGLDEMAVGVGEVYEAGQTSEYDRFWDAYQDNGNRTRWTGAFSGRGWNKKTFKPKHPIKMKAGYENSDRVFWYFGENTTPLMDFTEWSKMLDFSEATTVTSAFENAYLQRLTVDFSNATSMNRTFAISNGGNMNFLTIKVSDKCTSFTDAFMYHINTTTIIFTDDSVIAANINFQHSRWLTKASITSIINALSTTASGKTVTFSKTAKERGFTADEWATLIAPKSNWTISLV